MLRRILWVRILFALLTSVIAIAVITPAAIAQVRVPVHTGGAGVPPIGGSFGGGVNLPQDTLRNSLEVRNLSGTSIQTYQTPEVRAQEAMPAAARASDDPIYDGRNLSRIVSPSYANETTNAAGGPPPSVEEPNDGDDGGDDEDDDEDDEEYLSYQQMQAGAGDVQREPPQPEPAPAAKPFPWKAVIFGIIFAICILGFFSRKS